MSCGSRPLTLPVLETEIGFWALPANFEASAEQMSVLCDAITWQHSGFWSSHLVQCRELFADHGLLERRLLADEGLELPALLFALEKTLRKGYSLLGIGYLERL